MNLKKLLFVLFFSMSFIGSSQFISKWKTDNAGASQNNQIILPLDGSGNYDFTVDWGDGSTDQIISYNQPEIVHTYPAAGTYTVTINGTISGWRFLNKWDKDKIIEIVNWGSLQLGNRGDYFSGCRNLTITATDTLDLSGITSLKSMFSNCTALATIPGIETWDVSQVTDMTNLFLNAKLFNQNINGWDVSNVTKLTRTFYGAAAFNQPLDNWVVSKVTDMSALFAHATVFNQPIGNWDVRQVRGMLAMLWNATSFNQPIGDWDTQSVQNLARMFENATSFNQPIGGWNTQQVTTLEDTFKNATAFNQPINDWEVSAVTNMSRTFYNAVRFNQPLDNWNTENVTLFRATFRNAVAFDQNINDWKVVKATDMNTMFFDATRFNQPLDKWDVSGVKSLINMFVNAKAFNQPIGNWDVSNVTHIQTMFRGASSFDQDLGDWNVVSLINATNLFSGAAISTTNYNNLLIGWANTATLQNNVQFGAGTATYADCAAVLAARDTLINTYNWTISDGGSVAESCSTPFVSVWKTDNTGATSNNEILLPLNSNGIYDFTVEWGDGTSDQITSANQPEVIHTYPAAGTYTVTINGTINGWRFHSQEGDAQKLLEISNWGVLQLGNSGEYFAGCRNLIITATDTLDLSGTTSLAHMFFDCVKLSEVPNIQDWDVSNVTTMEGMFWEAQLFNSAIDNWNVGSVTSMKNMFAGARLFNQELNGWDVSSVTDMTGMFETTQFFNQDISDWEISNVTSLAWMFRNATAFDQNLGDWDISSIVDMQDMFKGAMLSTANYDALLIGWGTIVTNTPAAKRQHTKQQSVIPNAIVFDAGNSQYTPNSDASIARNSLINNHNWTITDGGAIPVPQTPFISVWNAGAAVDAEGGLFIGTNNSIVLPLVSTGTYDFMVDWGDGTTDHITAFDQDEVEHEYAEGGAYTVTITGTINGWSFGGLDEEGIEPPKLLEIKQWGALQLGNQGSYFSGAENLTITATDIPDLSGTTSLRAMFAGATSLTTIPNLALWDVSQVTDMGYLFSGAILFNQDISDWDVRQVTTMDGMFRNAISFDQNLGDWNIYEVTTMQSMFQGVTLSTANYDGILTGWLVQTDEETPPVQENVVFDAGNSQYTLDSNVANNKDILSLFFRWKITDGGAIGEEQNPFVSVWTVSPPTTKNATSSFNGSKPISLPLVATGTYDFIVDWGDETSDHITSFDQAEIIHEYENFGTYTVTITGVLNGWSFNNSFYARRIEEITEWGDLKLGNEGGYFDGCHMLKITATDQLDVSGTTNMNRMFKNCRAITTIPTIETWEVGHVTDMSNMFEHARQFNQDISDWNTSNVTNMEYMFTSANLFNQPINSWNVGKVTSMEAMFVNALSFNQNIGEWDLRSITNLQNMFAGGVIPRTTYDAILQGWATPILDENTNQAVPRVKNNIVFHAGNSQFTVNSNAQIARNTLINNFNWTIIDIGSTTVPSDTTFVSVWATTPNFSLSNTGKSIFNLSKSIALPITSTGTYDFIVDWGDGTTEHITSYSESNRSHLYSEAGRYTVKIDGLIQGWQFRGTGNAQKILAINNWGSLQLGNDGSYFKNCSNLVLNATDTLDTSDITDMNHMFAYCQKINNINGIENWDTSQVTTMEGMFDNALGFNQDISTWDVSNVTSMKNMFHNARNFDQDLGDWDVKNVTTMENMFSGVTLSTANYDSLLEGWLTPNEDSEEEESPIVQNDVIFDAGDSQYSVGSAAANARNTLINTYNWTITDGGSTGNTIPAFLVTSFVQNVVNTLLAPYPNPTNGILSIHGMDMENLQVIDLAGRPVQVGIQRIATDTYQVDMQHLANGMYVLVVNQNNQPTTYQISKQ